MAVKKVLVNLDFNGNQIINVRAEVAASAPANATPGRFYYNSTDEKLYVYTTNGWQVVGQDIPSDIVTGSGLTANHVVLGNGNGTVKISPYTLGISVPADAEFTDEYVGQQPASGATAADYPILFSQSFDTINSRIGKTYFDPRIKFNPSTGVFTAGSIAAATGITVNGNPVATQSYVDQQDQKINDRISSISGFGRYLSGWDMATGEPTSMPTTATYTLQTGDYFVISNVPSSGTKYKPNQTGTWDVSQPFAKTSTSDSCVVGGYWKYDGSIWSYFAPEQVVSLPAFTNSSRGGLIGNQASGYVYHDSSDAEGRAKVYGWAGKADNSNSHTITISGDATGSGSHTNASGNNATISVTITNGAITTAKIADRSVTTDKINYGAVTYSELAAKAAVVGIVSAADHSEYPDNPYWSPTGNANEYSAHAPYGTTRNGTIRLCDENYNVVECVYEYGVDETGIYDCTVYINSATAPASYAYSFLCRKEPN